MKASTAIIHDTRTQKKDGTFPVKLRITFERKQKYYPSGIDLTEDDFTKVNAAKPRGEFKEHKIFLEAIEYKACKIIKDIYQFSFEAFEKKFSQKSGDDRSVLATFEGKINQTTIEGRAGTSDSYKCAMNSIRQFVKRKTLTFEQITPEWLRSYEKWMIDQSNSLTTTGIYLRNLRTLFNEKIAEGIIQLDSYPFGKHKYQIPAGRNVKKALSLSEIESIFRYEPVRENESRARDLWMLSYLLNGINMRDICSLRYKNINSNKIVFSRSKTKNTSRKNHKSIVAIITPEVEAIIDRWGQKPASPNTFIFNILSDGLTPTQELAKVKQATKIINKWIKHVAASVGIHKNLTTYSARHSFATVLKRSGAPIEFISESLGHHDLRTTENYLDSFEDDVKQQYAKALLSFNQPK